MTAMGGKVGDGGIEQKRKKDPDMDNNGVTAGGWEV